MWSLLKVLTFCSSSIKAVAFLSFLEVTVSVFEIFIKLRSPWNLLWVDDTNHTSFPCSRKNRWRKKTSSKNIFCVLMSSRWLEMIYESFQCSDRLAFIYGAGQHAYYTQTHGERELYTEEAIYICWGVKRHVFRICWWWKMDLKVSVKAAEGKRSFTLCFMRPISQHFLGIMVRYYAKAILPYCNI